MIMNDNDNAHFNYDGKIVPITKGSLVRFNGKRLHNTVVEKGHVNLLGPFEGRYLQRVNVMFASGTPPTEEPLPIESPTDPFITSKAGKFPKSSKTAGPTDTLGKATKEPLAKSSKTSGPTDSFGRSPNRLIVDDATNDDNSVISLSPAKMEELSFFVGAPVLINDKFPILVLADETCGDAHVRMTKVVRDRIGLRLTELVTVTLLSSNGFSTKSAKTAGPTSDSIGSAKSAKTAGPIDIFGKATKEPLTKSSKTASPTGDTLKTASPTGDTLKSKGSKGM